MWIVYCLANVENKLVANQNAALIKTFNKIGNNSYEPWSFIRLCYATVRVVSSNKVKVIR